MVNKNCLTLKAKTIKEYIYSQTRELDDKASKYDD